MAPRSSNDNHQGAAMKKRLIFAFIEFLDFFIRLFTKKVSTHRILLGPGIEPFRWWLGRWRAVRTFELAAKRVPAYKAFLKEHHFNPRFDISQDFTNAFERIPEMDKKSYIRKWSILERSYNGQLPRRGVVVDESSGSSGAPTSWVRGPLERAVTRQLLQVGFSQNASHFNKQPFVLNAFSLGAWATGMNVTMSLIDVTMLKSVGPDKDKIIATMQEFGPNYTYIIVSYPPFLKLLFDDKRLDWEKYDVVTAFGGEGISENMRAYINQYAYSALGSYGASDLEINIAIETDFTVALRQAIARSPKLSRRLTKQEEYGVLPMIFQFNPYDYLIETNKKGEMIVTIVRKENVNPRIRYNIHDRGHVLRMRDIAPVLEEFGMQAILKQRFLDLPLLFHYGRSDMSVDYNGAVVAPDAVRDVIFSEPTLIDAIENHRLISYEDDSGDKQLHIALQLSATNKVIDQSYWYDFIWRELRRMNGDFDHAILTASDNALPTVCIYPYRTGPFAEDGKKLKNEYVWHLEKQDVMKWQLDTKHVVSKIEEKV
jgi:phenylacetate-CoA ligase